MEPADACKYIVSYKLKLTVSQVYDTSTLGTGEHTLIFAGIYYRVALHKTIFQLMHIFLKKTHVYYDNILEICA